MTGKAEHIRDLRGIADGGWKTLAFMFGRPDAIIRKGFISLAEHREISNWLRHFEHFVRRLLLVLALAIDLPPPAPSKRGPRTTRPAFFQRTRVLTVLLGRTWRRQKRARRKPLKVRCAADTPVRSAPLGRRFEALRHALAHIDASAMRVARAIRRTLNAPVRRCFVRLKPWRVQPWRATVASNVFGKFILEIEQHLPEVFVEPG